MSKDNHAPYTDEDSLGELGLVLMILVLDFVEHIMGKIKSIFAKEKEPVAYNWGDYDDERCAEFASHGDQLLRRFVVAYNWGDYDDDEPWFEEAD